MKILYCGLKYDYGQPDRGLSFEHYNLYESLVSMNEGEHEIIYFPFDEEMHNYGREEMNHRLIKVFENEHPDIGFFCLFQDEISPKTLDKIKEYIPTFNWFTDDHWRFHNFSKYYAPHFTFVGTTDSRAPEKYKEAGIDNVIKTQWAANHHTYKPTGVKASRIGQRNNTEYKFDVTFVGQPHSNRRQVIAKIKAAGIRVDCWGNGWDNGRISQEGMLDVFSNSKINLNLTKSSEQISFKQLVKIFIRRRSNETYTFYSPKLWLDNWRSLRSKSREQIKGRNFEVPATGGLLMTANADNLSDYYTNQEVAIFKNNDDLIDQIKDLLKNTEKRETIALAGYNKTISKHTYEKRFNDIFRAMGLINS